jgi:diguanylate cyclase (GGDEF)-like protein
LEEDRSPQAAVSGSKTVLATLGEQLSNLEKRDWELWLIVSVTGVLVSAGFLALCFPSVFLNDDSLHLDLTLSRPLFIGLIALIVLMNFYLISRRFELRRVRETVISTTIQSELVRLQSFLDPLTEVYNRRSLDDLATRHIRYAQRTKTRLTFLMIDIDKFKDVNTRFGHMTGDLVIREVAAILKNSVRGSDIVVRYGGDEFLIILPDTSTTGAVIVVNRIKESVQNWSGDNNLKRLSLSVSIGISEWNEGETLDSVLNDSDQDMYSEKRSSALR